MIDVVLKQARADANKGARNDPQNTFRGIPDKGGSIQGIKKILVSLFGSLLSGAEIIKMLNEETGASIAFLQKFVNMTLKYIVVLQTIKGDMPGLKVNEKDCDCPLDSIILNKLNERVDKKFHCWTHLEENEYERAQKSIMETGKQKLEYDFENWMHQ